MKTVNLKSITVWGVEYKNVDASFDDKGVCIGGRIPGVGKFAADSAVAALINGQSDIGTVEA